MNQGNNTRRRLCYGVCTILVLIIIAFVIIAVIIASTFKMPAVDISGVRPPNEPVLNISADDGGSLDTRAIVDVTVKNPNTYDIYVTSLEVAGYFKQAKDIPFGTVDQSYINLPGDNQVTKLELPIDIAWRQRTDPKGVVIAELNKACRVGGEKLTMIYKVNIWAKIWGLGPVKVPEFEREITTQCPFALPEGADAISIVKNFGGQQ